MRRRPPRFSIQAAEAQHAMETTCAQFGLSLVSSEDDAWGLRLLYRNSTTGLQLEYSPGEQQGWRAVIGKLTDGTFPKHPVHFKQDTDLQRFDLRDLAAERIQELPEYRDKILSKVPLTIGELTGIVSRSAADVFAGKFSVFSALRLRVLARTQPV